MRKRSERSEQSEEPSERKRAEANGSVGWAKAHRAQHKHPLVSLVPTLPSLTSLVKFARSSIQPAIFFHNLCWNVANEMSGRETQVMEGNGWLIPRPTVPALSLNHLTARPSPEGEEWREVVESEWNERWQGRVDRWGIRGYWAYRAPGLQHTYAPSLHTLRLLGLRALPYPYPHLPTLNFAHYVRSPQVARRV